MKTVARRREGFTHEVEIEGGHTIVVDEPADAGGGDAGPTPTRLLAASLAGCIAITIEMYAERKGWDVGDVVVEVETDYERHAPVAFDVVLRLPDSLTDAEKERLVGIAAKCPVHRVLSHEVEVSIADRVEPL